MSGLSAGNADEFYEVIAKKLETPEFLPRALFESFRIEVLATTDSPLDTLEFHQAIKRFGMEGEGDSDVSSGRGGGCGVCGVQGKH